MASAVAAPDASTVSLSLRLLKVPTPFEALKVGHELAPIDCDLGELWISQSAPVPPGWVSFVGELAPSAPGILRTQTCAAILFVETTQPEKRLFAICFGQGHHSLDESAIERGFGLKVTLNQVSRDRLRTIDSAALDSTVMQRRMQASRNSDLAAFEIDTDRELVRLASGSPSSSEFAKALSGRDALTVRVQMAPRRIVAYCEQALKIYHGKTYQRDFAFIDHVQPIADRALSAELDALAFDELSTLVAGGQSDLHLAFPDIVGPEEDVSIGYFGAGLPSGKVTYGELAVEDYLTELKRGDFGSIADMATVRLSHEVCVMQDGKANRAHRRKLYTCFVFEAQHRGETYVLFDGQWYLVDKSFFAEVEHSYQGLIATPFLVSTTAANERELIEELSTDPLLLCLDQTRASPAGAPGANLEPCDFLSMTCQLIHLKDGHGSAPLSHLWNQGLVSTESFVRDATFRSDFRKAVAARERKFRRSGFLPLIPDGRSKPIPTDFVVVFGVMRHAHFKTKSLGLPFFSKIALRSVAQRIELMGFKVELHLIAKV